VLGLPKDGTKGDANKAVRTLCKGLNFGLQYGAGPRKFALVANQELAKKDKITEADAAKYIEKYFKEYSGVQPFKAMYCREVKAKGYATTILGRRRYLPNIRLPRNTKELWWKAAAAERAAVSTLIQGTAGDILKLAMNLAFSKGIHFAGQVHDQVLVHTTPATRDRDEATVKECLEHCGLDLLVPVVANIQVVEKWEGGLIERERDPYKDPDIEE
ncbi:MAG: DNA polymerase, partial [Terriglobia bacterium]